MSSVLNDKAIIVLKDGAGVITSRGGKFESAIANGETGQGFINTQIREFGTYYIRIDTTAPQIKILNVVSARNMRTYKKILIKITDNLSGIVDFDTYIDGKWTLTEYDAKYFMLTHTLDQNLPAGEHIFKVVVTDERKNVAEYSVKFAM